MSETTQKWTEGAIEMIRHVRDKQRSDGHTGLDPACEECELLNKAEALLSSLGGK